METEMNTADEALEKLNALADKIYDYVEGGTIKFTRRRLLILQQMLYVDSNVNSVFHLLKHQPPFLDGSEMILRSIYDLLINVDWILKDRSNKRFWRWIRDDKKTLHKRLKSMVDLKTRYPKLNTKLDPMSQWTDALQKTHHELLSAERKSNTRANESELSLFSKVETFKPKVQQLYHTIFWLFSTKTHATPSGLQGLIQPNPLRFRRRETPPTQAEREHAAMLMGTAISWYASLIYRNARYLQTPYVDEAKILYDDILTKPLTV